MADTQVKKPLQIKYLIVNSDDGFYCSSRDLGILHGLQCGMISDLSILTNGLVAKAILILPVEQRFGVSSLYDYLRHSNLLPGIHINLSEGIPLTSSEKIPSLLNEEGFLRGKMGIREALRSGEISMAEVRTEVKAQIDAFVQLFGKRPSHLDGHQHVHVLPGIVHEIGAIMKEFSIPATRVPFQVVANTNSFLQHVVQNALEAAKIFADLDIKFPRRFTGLQSMGALLTYENLTAEMMQCNVDISTPSGDTPSSEDPSVWDCTLELMVHPGLPSWSDNNEPGGCGGFGADSFSRSLDRCLELHFLSSTQFARWCAVHFQMVMSFDQLTKLAIK